MDKIYIRSLRVTQIGTNLHKTLSWICIMFKKSRNKAFEAMRCEKEVENLTLVLRYWKKKRKANIPQTIFNTCYTLINQFNCFFDFEFFYLSRNKTINWFESQLQA